MTVVRLAETIKLAISANYAIIFPLISVSSLVSVISTKEDAILGNIATALGSAIGFILALALVSIVREVLSTGALAIYNPLDVQAITSIRLFPLDFAMPFFAEPAGAFISVGVLSALIAALQNKSKSNKDGKAVT